MWEPCLVFFSDFPHQQHTCAISTAHFRIISLSPTCLPAQRHWSFESAHTIVSKRLSRPAFSAYWERMMRYIVCLKPFFTKSFQNWTPQCRRDKMTQSGPEWLAGPMGSPERISPERSSRQKWVRFKPRAGVGGSWTLWGLNGRLFVCFPPLFYRTSSPLGPLPKKLLKHMSI